MSDSLLSIHDVTIPTLTRCIPDDDDDADEGPIIHSDASTTGKLVSLHQVQIVLNRTEERLFQTLVDTAQAYEAGLIRFDDDDDDEKNTHVGPSLLQPSSASSSLLLEIRVAGGWVRDKLLGLGTHDVDIAVNLLTGVQFATLIRAYLNQSEHSDWAGSMGVIAANPAQSKHLETATMKVCGIEVDFANLRAQEIYEHHSRIPVTQFGTPLDDAQRRDFTINALFYNLRTRCVEDWTRRGIEDLMANRLVTPLDPVQTFRDDPLRVLRAIRFGVRYNLDMDQALAQAAMLEEIHRALHVKVSRERVGKELEGMLSGKGANPVAALRLISSLKLAGSVFALPIVGQDNVASISGTIAGIPYEGVTNSEESRHIRQLGWEESLMLLEFLPSVTQAHRLAGTEPRLDSRLLPIAVFLLPFRHLSYLETRKSGKETLAVSFVLRDGIKFKGKDVQSMTVLMQSVDRMVDFLTSFALDAKSRQCRLTAGLLLRSTKELWVTLLALATVVKLRQAERGEDGSTDHVDWLQSSMEVYRTILSLNLDDCWNMRPLMDGKAIIQALGLPHGPEVGNFLDAQVKWMLLNPSGTREECESYLLSVKRRMQEAEDATETVGMSDGTGMTPSSPIQGGKKTMKHFSKKMHVESLDDM